MTQAALFPFSAITAQPAMQLALLLAALDPAIGGVLIEGPSGTAKSTAARALAELLPAQAPFVTLPLGASLEHVAGSLDLNSAMQDHALQFAPGLLARAHGGVLYVDEINLLPDAIVDVLLDAAASGVHTVERDGISHSHPARFVLIGTMNPEEGPLRPQLLDRLGLSVRLENVSDARLRQQIVKTRLAFDADPQGFRQQHAHDNQILAERLAAARALLAAPTDQAAGFAGLSDAVFEAVSQGCIAAGVNGLRADMVWLRAARALAAWQGQSEVNADHAEQVAALVLAHRSASGHTLPSSAAAPAPSTSQSTPPSQTLASASSKPSTGAPLASTHTQPSHAPADRQSPATDPDGTAQPDWGALPPEPAGLQRMATTNRLLPTGRAGQTAKKP